MLLAACEFATPSGRLSLDLAASPKAAKETVAGCRLVKKGDVWHRRERSKFRTPRASAALHMT